MTVTADQPVVAVGERRGRSNDRTADLVVALVTLVVTAPLFWRLRDDYNLVRGQNDVFGHVSLIDQFRLVPFRLPAPHFLFHLVVYGLRSIGLDQMDAAAIVLMGASVAVAVLVQRWLRSSGVGPLVAVIATIGFVVAESPAVLVRGSADLGIGAYAPLHLWNLATSVAVLPFAIALLAAVSRSDLGRRGGPAMRGAVVLAILGTLAKPSLAAALPPGLVIWWLLRSAAGRPVPRPAVRWLGLAVVLPLVLTFAAEMVLWAVAVDPGRAAGYEFAPLEGLEVVGGVDLVFWLVLAFPLAVLVLYRSEAIRDDAVAISLASLLGTAPVMLLWDDTGWRQGQVSLSHPVLLSIVLLVLSCLRFLLLAPRDRWRLRHGVLGLVLAGYVASGVAAWLHDSGAYGTPPRRSYIPSRVEVEGGT